MQLVARHLQLASTSCQLVTKALPSTPALWFILNLELQGVVKPAEVAVEESSKAAVKTGTKHEAESLARKAQASNEAYKHVSCMHGPLHITKLAQLGGPTKAHETPSLPSSTHTYDAQSLMLPCKVSLRFSVRQYARHMNTVLLCWQAEPENHELHAHPLNVFVCHKSLTSID